MQISNSTNFSFFNINSQVINNKKANNKSIDNFSIQETVEKSDYVSSENLQKEKHIGLITVYEDDKFLIQIANRNDTNASLEELEALGWLRQVTIFDKSTKSLTIIDNVEMADNFYNTFANFLKKNDLNIGDFIAYARNKLYSNLFDLFFEEMGWKVTHQEWINESDISKETRLISDGRKDNHLYTKTQQNKLSALSGVSILQFNLNNGATTKAEAKSDIT